MAIRVNFVYVIGHLCHPGRLHGARVVVGYVDLVEKFPRKHRRGVCVAAEDNIACVSCRIT